MNTTPVDAAPTTVAVDSIRIENSPSPGVTLAGSFSHSQPPTAVTARLSGARASVVGDVTVDGARWRAHFTLLTSRWGGPTLPTPSGTYRLHISGVDGEIPITSVTAALPGRELVDGFFALSIGLASTRNAVGMDVAKLTITVAPPLTDSEVGAENQSRLEAHYRSTRFEPENAVFFESFYGQNVSCNPLGIDRVIAARLPQVARYWSVIDASVAVPEGASALIEGSEEWWRIRGSARLLVVNDWLRKRHKRQPHQKVLQTWHGTPLKKIALSRPGIGVRAALASIRESSHWDILLAQNEHSARTIRLAYAFLGRLWQVGYPRNDVLVHGDSAAVRERLGIAAGVTVLLYAPTWRDDRPGHVDHLDVAGFADALGPDYVTLIRGHSRSLKPGEDIRGHRVLDVTSYPDVSDLFLVADALITDYSSVMFDFSVTGKPMFFFAPDLTHYREQLRGFYFDLAAVAPGPLVQEPGELITLVHGRDRVHEKFAVAYAAWQARFNPHDDGQAGHRVVERLLREGILAE